MRLHKYIVEKYTDETKTIKVKDVKEGDFVEDRGVVDNKSLQSHMIVLRFNKERIVYDEEDEVKILKK